MLVSSLQIRNCHSTLKLASKFLFRSKRTYGDSTSFLHDALLSRILMILPGASYSTAKVIIHFSWSFNRSSFMIDLFPKIWHRRQDDILCERNLSDVILVCNSLGVGSRLFYSSRVFHEWRQSDSYSTRFMCFLSLPISIYGFPNKVEVPDCRALKREGTQGKGIYLVAAGWYWVSLSILA